ncbi:polygalacturonase-like [Oryza brachyantha]|uniref:endo-polygalacturonase n=1 Tax=Oryza brachyantha TaxID=4533 RepID=J3MJQ1_ORYBR|nr:polygalacturonase-like [Oryza brachyantha]
MASTVLNFSASLLTLFFFFLRSADAEIGSSNIFSMQSYGARGDGRHDDTKALVDAWAAACSSAKPAVVLIPKGKKYLTKHTTLSGPCKSSILLMVKGSLVASPERSDWSKETVKHWILFSGVTSLTVTGGGTIDGNGKIWWQNSCKTNSKLPCTQAPTALTFYSCKNLKVENLKVVNSQQIQISVEDCTHVKMSRLSIFAPETSPNTDGIHITRSRDVQVADCTIKTGDDCMSIEDGTENLHVKNLVCGPGHGISIGSLGDHSSEDHVNNVTVDNVRMYGTTNGARIKTWQGGKGSAKNIVFQNMIMDNVWNPIIIDQNYCDSSTPCKQQKSAVEVSNVLFKNIRGTSASEEAIMLHCSSSVPCHAITLENVKLTVKGGSSDAKSTCQNAEWKKSGSVSPQPCGFSN